VNGIAALAAKEALVASGLGPSVLPGVAPSALEGFAVGSLLSGVCFLMVMAPRRVRRARWSAKRRARLPGIDAQQRPQAPAQASADAGAGAGTGADDYAAAPTDNPFADESAEILVPAGTAARLEMSQASQSHSGGHRGKPRLPDSDGSSRRPDARRGAPRHAARSPGIGSKVTSVFSSHPAGARD